MITDMIKVLANDGIDTEGKNILSKAGFQIDTEKIAQDALAKGINEKGYEVLLVRSATKVRKDIIDSCPGLKVIGRGGVGLDNIDVDHAKGKGIAVINTPAASSLSVAELVFAHFFSLVRFLHDSNRKMPVEGDTKFNDLKKKYSTGIELRGKTIGIIGFGRIGQAAGKIAAGLGMKILAFDPFVKEAAIDVEIHGAGAVKVKVTTSPLEEVLRNSDFITLHVPGGKVIGTKEFEMMKNGVVLVNAARGGVIDETELLKALDSGKVAGAGLDVFENEPTPSKALLSHPKISLTPHSGASTGEAQERIAVELAEKIISHFKK
jgi:D-3-phosphoglycerate dehydrogenase